MVEIVKKEDAIKQEVVKRLLTEFPSLREKAYKTPRNAASVFAVDFTKVESIVETACYEPLQKTISRFLQSGQKLPQGKDYEYDDDDGDFDVTTPVLPDDKLEQLDLLNAVNEQSQLAKQAADAFKKAQADSKQQAGEQSSVDSGQLDSLPAGSGTSTPISEEE